MITVDDLYSAIVADLVAAGERSPYPADANEPDPRYKSYGVRAAGKKAILKTHRAAIRALSQAERLALARQLIYSEVGEQQSVALAILEPLADYFTPERFGELDALVRQLHGWSKIDEYTGSLLREVLLRYPDPLLALAQTWNQDADLWLRRASVVLFTRKVAKTGRFTDQALALGETLLFDPEDLVQKGVGWMLKDLLKTDRPRLLAYVKDLRQRGVSSVITLYAIRDVKGAERAAVLAVKDK